jgi:hypothetical protein
MAFQPDIIVTGPEGVMLVVEAKTTLPNLRDSEEQLKRYMIGTQCPTGVLITPKHMWLYRDVFTARSPESIRQIGSFETKGFWRQSPPTQSTAFEIFVQQWLERLAHEPTQDLPRDVRQSLSEYVLPALTNGEVRAARPRY